MNGQDEPAEAYRFAKAHAEAALAHAPFDAVYRHTLEQLALLRLTDDGMEFVRGRFDLGLMAAKELGNDERDFAHALHILQRHVDRAGDVRP